MHIYYVYILDMCTHAILTPYTYYTCAHTIYTHIYILHTHAYTVSTHTHVYIPYMHIETRMTMTAPRSSNTGTGAAAAPALLRPGADSQRRGHTVTESSGSSPEKLWTAAEKARGSPWHGSA